MKKKIIFLMGILIITLMIFFNNSVSYAAKCSYCLAGSFHANCTEGLVRVASGNTTNHDVKCKCCSIIVYTENHTWGSWTSADSSNHIKACTKCYGSIRNAHTETTAATCTTAAYCGTCKSYYGDALGHNYGNYVANGATGHRQLCSRCNTYSSTVAHDYYSLSSSASTPGYHSRVCKTCGYETDLEKHNMVVYDTGKNAAGYYHSFKCNICNNYSENIIPCTMTSKVTREATCTIAGNRRYTCSVCSQYYDEAIAKIAHDWSEWQTTKTEHWKICNYGCGTESSRGTHFDTNPKNGYCDTCNYLMYIIPVGSIKGANGSASTYAVKETETAEFYVTLTEGSQPLSYQWFYKNTSTGTGIEISGATDSKLSLVANRNMNSRYYYCVITNPGGSCTTNSVQLTVYYTFTISPQPKDVNLKKGETGTFTVGIDSAGNPDEYTYQWYRANSATGAGSKISNATKNTYSVSPTENIHAQYYYCVVSNGQYEVESNRAKLVADVTLPKITMGSFNDGIIINKTATLKIPFTVSDTGEGYTENNSNFTSSDIIVKVDGTTNTVTKTLTYKGASGNNHNYELTLSNINGNGKLSFEVPANSVQDDFGNKNILTTFSTNVTIDNIAPAIIFESITGDLNGKYANTDDTLVIKVAITEAVGINLNELTADDIIVKVGGTEANSLLEKELKYVNKVGNKYTYELTLNNLKGDGALSLYIPAASIQDLATNPNLQTELAVKIDGENVIIDNTKPVINSIVSSLGSYNNASTLYPDSLSSMHNGWANENIYVQINAEDNQEIDYYMKSVGNNNSYSQISSYRDLISESVESEIFYRVVDMAGNYAEASKDFKLDKITPNKPIISLFEQRQNGAEYIFNANKPTDKSIYVIPDASTIVDAENVKSGIQTDIAYTYYIINSYKDLSKSETIASPLTFAWNEGFLLEETGYYEVQMTMTDIAGNQVVSDVFKVYINKKAENTIRITNMNDIGSGIKKVTIKVFEGDDTGNRTSTEAIDAIVIDNPYKEIIKNVRLGEGTFYVEVTLEDKVGWTTILKKTIVNDL